ncbi:MAG TPA: M1 family metallopeptidase [Candidatus Atribacteria bacterium]|nr:M1 family metallopeptidase [Candidatus Atribacteria bacterium]
MRPQPKKTLKLALIAALITALAVCPLIIYVSSTPGHGQNPVLERAAKSLNRYEISVDFDPAAGMLYCDQSIVYINRTDKDLTHIYFHLYPNAYKYEDRPVFPQEDMPRAYPDGFSSGYLELEDVTVDGRGCLYTVGGHSDSLLMLVLDNSLAPGESTTIGFKYSVKLPYCLGRFGYGDHTYKAANWYPIACVYDENGWNLDRYYPIGDPFYSEAANYYVTIRAPYGYILATTGDILSMREKDGIAVWTIKALAVRDFAWVASDRFKVLSRKVGKTMVHSYYFSSHGDMALDYGASAIEAFNSAFGEYPYKQFSIVEADFYIGGMEYPNLVMIDHSLYSSGTFKWLELIIAHETAHQWWYGLVGNNQIKDAWLDEGLTEYSTVLYYGLRYGREKEEEMYRNEIAWGKYRYIQELALSEPDIDQTIHKPAYEFPDWYIYDALVYGKGAVMFHGIRKQIGDQMFFDVLKQYYEKFRFSNAGKDDLIGVLNSITGRDWEGYLDKWLYDDN